MTEKPASPWRHHELGAKPAVKPATLAGEFARLTAAEGGQSTDLWAGILTLIQGKALAIEASSGAGVDILWAEPDSGFRDGLTSEWLATFSRVRRQGRPMIESIESPSPMVRLTVPLSGSSIICGCLLPSTQPEEQSKRMTLFQASCGFLLSRELFQKREQESSIILHSAAWVDMATETLGETDADAAFLRLSEGLRKHLSLSSVALGLTRQGGKSRILAISGQIEVDERGRLPRLIQALFRAHRDDETPLCSEDPSSRVSPPFEEMKRQFPNTPVTLLPLGVPGTDPRFLLLCLGEPPPENFLGALSNPLASLVGQVHRTRRRGLRKWSARVWGKARPWKTILAITTSLLLLFLLLQPVPERIRVKGQLEPENRNLIAARVSGLLQESTVRPGDWVEEGQALAILEDRELSLRESELLATEDQRRKQRDVLAADPETDVAELQIANLMLEETRLQVQQLQIRKDHLILRAPASGQLVSGDLTRRIGDSIDAGELLFEIAPLDEFVVELEVPSRRVASLEPGLPVRFRLEAYPDRTFSEHIEYIHPRSQSNLSGNPFVVEVPFPEDTGLEAKPGLRVDAVIEGPVKMRVSHLFRTLSRRLRLLFFP